jgi:hypothetical protein
MLKRMLSNYIQKNKTLLSELTNDSTSQYTVTVALPYLHLLAVYGSMTGILAKHQAGKKRDFSPCVQTSYGPTQPCTHLKGTRYGEGHSPLPSANIKNV